MAEHNRHERALWRQPSIIIALSLSALPVFLLLAYAFVATMANRDWVANLALAAVPAVLVLGLGLGLLARARFWDRLGPSALLRLENRETAANILPLVLFFSLCRLKPEMGWSEVLAVYAGTLALNVTLVTTVILAGRRFEAWWTHPARSRPPHR